MGRTATKAQDARARAREARWAFLEARSAQDARIEEATVAALLALEDRSAAQRAISAALQQLARGEAEGSGDRCAHRAHRRGVLTSAADAGERDQRGRDRDGRGCRWVTGRWPSWRPRCATPPSWLGTKQRSSAGPDRTAGGGVARSRAVVMAGSTSGRLHRTQPGMSHGTWLSSRTGSAMAWSTGRRR